MIMIHLPLTWGCIVRCPTCALSCPWSSRRIWNDACNRELWVFCHQTSLDATLTVSPVSNPRHHEVQGKPSKSSEDSDMLRFIDLLESRGCRLRPSSEYSLLWHIWDDFYCLFDAVRTWGTPAKSHILETSYLAHCQDILTVVCCFFKTPYSDAIVFMWRW